MNSWLFAGLVLAVEVGCTHGNRCDAQHPCSPGDSCLDGLCEAPCDNDGELQAGGTCLYALPTCDEVLSLCTRPCVLEEADEWHGIGSGDCPPTLTCTIGTDGPRCLADSDGALASCATDTDCSTVVFEVER
jgi:hypothetical protein